MGEAAALPLVSLTALQALRDSMRVRPGHRVLINGASGGLGLHAVQVARLLGAEVTGVCSHRNLERVRRAGAAVVVDYTAQDPRQLAVTFDGLFDCFGNLPYSKAKRLVSHPRRHVGVIPRPDTVARELSARLGLAQPRLVVVRSRADDLATVMRWAARRSGSTTTCISRSLPPKMKRSATPGTRSSCWRTSFSKKVRYSFTERGFSGTVMRIIQITGEALAPVALITGRSTLVG